MNSAKVTRVGPWPLAILTVAVTALAGCDETMLAKKTSTEDAKGEQQASSSQSELLPEISGASQRDVEAPDVFQATEAGLWDGRPSLGGVWVAHPDVRQPERVKITNPGNNKSVTGALFRRERDLPGPALQVSSAAAEKLGMLAGSPTRLDVVALRREVIEPPAEPEPEAETTGATEEPPQESVPEEKPKRKWWQKKTPESTGVAAGAVAAGTAAAVAEGAPAAAEGAQAATEGAPAAASDTAVASGAAALTDPIVTPPPEKPAKRKWWQKKPANEITETPLDPIAGAAAAIEASEPNPASVSAPENSSKLAKPYIQIGTFGVEANAKTAADKVSKNGLAAQVQEISSAGKPVWRVLVGPASTRAERKAILGDMKDLGFSDAFIAKN